MSVNGTSATEPLVFSDTHTMSSFSPCVSGLQECHSLTQMQLLIHLTAQSPRINRLLLNCFAFHCHILNVSGQVTTGLSHVKNIVTI